MVPLKMKKPNPIPLSFFKNAFHCNFDTGEVFMKDYSDQPVGNKVVDPNSGYTFFKISIFQKHYKRSRIVYAMYHNDDLDGKIVDHIDGNSLNDSINNLRLASCHQNSMNRGLPGNNTTGLKGVVRYGKYQYKAQLVLNNKSIYIGTYYSRFDAARAYDEKAKLVFGDFARTNYQIAVSEQDQNKIDGLEDVKSDSQSDVDILFSNIKEQIEKYQLMNPGDRFMLVEKIECLRPLSAKLANQMLRKIGYVVRRKGKKKRNAVVF